MVVKSATAKSVTVVAPAPRVRPKKAQPTPARGVGAARPHSVRLLPWLLELKILTKDRRVVPLRDVINYAQLDFIRRCQHQLDSQGRIRICVLKARQLGLSTIIEGIIFLFSMLQEDSNSLVISHEGKSAQGILKMTKRYWRTYIFRRFHTEEYAGRTQLSWADTRSNIEIATAKNVDAGRSTTIQNLHASEVAFWDDPETLMTGLRQAMPTFGTTALFLESTANGVGNWFHQVCTKARKGQSEFEFAFYPWWDHPEYTASYLPREDAEKYPLAVLDKEELSLRSRFGLDDERLIWRRYAIENLCQGDVTKFHQEYPSDPDEAFVSTGRNVFPLPLILEHVLLEHGRRGRLVRGQRGKVEFLDDDDGWLTVFRPPSNDREWGVYLLGADPTHTVAGDNACAQVINRRTLEQVCVYRRKTDPISFAKDIELVGSWYHDAMIAPEKEGPGYATVGALVASNYPLVYQTQNVARAPGHPGDTYGWSTNVATKHLAVSHLLRAIKDPLAFVGDTQYGLVIHDEETAAEMRDYITTEDGRGYSNGDGSQFDDGVMALAIALTVHHIEPPVPAYVGRDPRALPANVANRPVATSGSGIATRSGAAPPLHAREPEPDPESDPIDMDREAPWEAWGRKDS